MRYLLITLLSFLAFSCIPHRKLLYLRPIEGNVPVIENFPKGISYQYKVQPGDVLHIEISSTVASQMEIFNKKFEGEKGGPNNSGYLVNKEGNIELPLAGFIHVDSMTVNEINNAVKLRLAEYIDFAYVSTKLVNFSITLLGEVRSPGARIISNENISIFQALGLAGDITDAGNKKKVKIIRKLWSETKVITLDVSDKKIVSSEYYYLMPNDVIYVEPLKIKAFKINIPSITLAMSTMTILFLIYNNFLK